MKRILFIITLLSAISIGVHSQIYIDKEGNVYDQREDKKSQPQQQVQNQQSVSKKSKFDASRLEFGGDFSFGFGSHTTSISISPQVGYKFSKYFSVGAGIGYNYYSDRDYYRLKEHFASLNLYGTLYPVKYLVFSVRPEVGRMWQSYELDGGDKVTNGKFVPSVVVGGGVRFGPVMAQVKYDVVQDKNSPYGKSVFYSVGFVF